VIRFWPAVFGGKLRGLPVLDAILESPEGQRCSADAVAESRRIAYVGLTRARDALVLALPGGPDGALRKLGADSWLASFASAASLPDGALLTLQDGHLIPTRRERIGATEARPPTTPYRPRRLPARQSTGPLPPETLLPSGAPPMATARLLEVAELGPRLPLAGPDMLAIGQALHAVIAAELVNPDRADALPRTAALLGREGGAGALDRARRSRQHAASRGG
jgi:ATP-dependent helicase/nuclease subunit A